MEKERVHIEIDPETLDYQVDVYGKLDHIYMVLQRICNQIKDGSFTEAPGMTVTRDLPPDEIN